MRNYALAYFTKVEAYDDPYPTSLQTEYSIGLTQAAAHGLAVASWGAIFSGFPHVDYTDLGATYLLLNKETIVGVFTSRPEAGSIAYLAFSGLSAAEGLSPGESPKHSTAWPTSDGRKFRTGVAFTSKNVVGKQTLTLLSYLILLRNTWDSGILMPDGSTIRAPKRWIDKITQVIELVEKGQMSPTQVYAWLNSVDFSK